jgi:hypothetical protein
MKKTNMTILRNRTLLAGVGLMLFIELAAIPFLGFDLGFAGGLAIGTGISALNMSMLAFLAERSIDRRKVVLSVFGFALRVLIFGGGLSAAAFFFGQIAAFGMALGFLTVYVAVFMVRLFAPTMFQRKGGKFEYAYAKSGWAAKGGHKFLLIRQYSMTAYRGGRTFVTHRRFRKMKRLQNDSARKEGNA